VSDDIVALDVVGDVMALLDGDVRVRGDRSRSAELVAFRTDSEVHDRFDAFHRGDRLGDLIDQLGLNSVDKSTPKQYPKALCPNTDSHPAWEDLHRHT